MEAINYFDGNLFWLFAAGTYGVLYIIITVETDRRRDELMKQILINSIRQGVNYFKHL